MPFLLPALLINLVIIFVPALLTLAMAFVEWDGVSEPTWAGLDNFRAIFADPVFFSALMNNVRWTLIFLTVPMLMGLVAASLLLMVRRGRTLFQIIYFLPVIIATVVTARVWQGMIFNPESGIGRLAAAIRDPSCPIRWPTRRRPFTRWRPSTSGTGGASSP